MLLQDVRYGVRTLLKSRGFAAIAVFTLGLGIGATTVVYSLSDALLWKPIPLPHLETLVAIGQRVPAEQSSMDQLTPADLEDIRHDITSLDGIAAFEEGMANIAGDGGEPERVIQAVVAVNYFDVICVQPAMGRGFQEGEGQQGREREVIFSDKLWRNRFGADASIVGKAIRLDDQNYEVIGVMPASFDYPVGCEAWTPLALDATQRSARNNGILGTVARLKAGRTVEQAGHELAGIGARLQKTYPDTNKNRGFVIWPLKRLMTDPDAEQYVGMLLGAVLFVLLIACGNVANLQFARATGRLREVALRTALGASRTRVIVQLITESVLLSLTGAVFGLLIAR
jgi:putative ABC transport system permease protein